MTDSRIRSRSGKQAKIVKRRPGRAVGKGAATRVSTPVAASRKGSDAGEGLRHPVVRLRARLQLTQAQFAPMLGVSIRTLAALEAGADPSEAVQRRRVELDRLSAALSEVLDSNAIGAWLLRANVAFGGSRPLELVVRGEVDRLWAMVYELRAGVAS